jgi:hypothetical protein
MVSDLEHHPDVEIADLWPLFLAAHPTLQVPSPLTRVAYVTLAPTLGPWLMATQDLTSVSAQLALESIWGCLVGFNGAFAAYRFQALSAVLQTPCLRWAAPFEVTMGYDGVLLRYPEILSALQIGSDRPEILAETAEVTAAMARMLRWDVTDADGVHHLAVSLNDVVDCLSPLSCLPACEALWHWIRTAYAPAIARHGYYDPARQHEPPPGQLLQALECRENAREILNLLLPGLGEETLEALKDTATAPLGQELDLFALPDVWRDLFNSLGLGNDTGDHPSY